MSVDSLPDKGAFAPIAGVLTLGLLCVVALAQLNGAKQDYAASSPADAAFSASTAALYSQRDLLLQEEALFDAERSAFEEPTSPVLAANLQRQDLALQLRERAAAASLAHEEAWHVTVAPRVVSLADLIHDLRSQLTAARPVQTSLSAGGALAVAAPGGGLALFAPSSPAQARIAHARRPVMVGKGATPPAQARLNYYSIRNGYAGRTVKNLYLLIPPASVRRLLIAASSSGFLTLLDLTTAHDYAPEFSV